jgi:hypothetical protein
MRQPIQLKSKTRSRGSALQIAFPIGLIFAFAILLAIAEPTNPNETFGQSPVGGPTLGNYPNTSLPLSTDTTVTPDADPILTSGISVSTSTDFNGTLEGDPRTGVVRVTNARPAGTYKVRVTAFGSGGATVTKKFRLRVTTPVTCNPVGFAAAASFSTGDYALAVAVGDFNGDGKQDLATANRGPIPVYTGGVSILLGDGTGSFSAPTTITFGDWHESIAVGDFNGDGKQDLAVANRGLWGSPYVSILLGDGTGHFSGPTNFAAGDWPYSIAVGDFNRDGKQDLAVANFSSSDVSILLGDGAGHFSAATNFGTDLGPKSLGWVILMVMANKISPLPTTSDLTCRSCWAMAQAISAARQTSALARTRTLFQ